MLKVLSCRPVSEPEPKSYEITCPLRFEIDNLVITSSEELAKKLHKLMPQKKYRVLKISSSLYCEEENRERLFWFKEKARKIYILSIHNHEHSLYDYTLENLIFMSNAFLSPMINKTKFAYIENEYGWDRQKVKILCEELEKLNDKDNLIRKIWKEIKAVFENDKEKGIQYFQDWKPTIEKLGGKRILRWYEKKVAFMRASMTVHF